MTPDDDRIGLNCHKTNDETLKNPGLYAIVSKKGESRTGKSHKQTTQEYTNNWAEAALESFKEWFKGPFAATCRNGLTNQQVDDAFATCGLKNITIAHATLAQGKKHRRVFFARINKNGITALQQCKLNVPDVVCIVFAIGHHPGKDNSKYETLKDCGVCTPGTHWQVESLGTLKTLPGPKFDGIHIQFYNCAFVDV